MEKPVLSHQKDIYYVNLFSDRFYDVYKYSSDIIKRAIIAQYRSFKSRLVPLKYITMIASGSNKISFQNFTPRINFMDVASEQKVG